MATRDRSVSTPITNRINSSSHSSKVRIPAPQASECAGCSRLFWLLLRRRHCRQCLRTFCKSCAPLRYCILDQRKVYIRLCNECSGQVESLRGTAARVYHSGRQLSVEGCPVCDREFSPRTEPLEQFEQHIENCLLVSSSSVRLKTSGLFSPEIIDRPLNEECAICLEVFKSGQKTARMKCLCLYHLECLESWFSRSKGGRFCPVHRPD